MRPPNQYMDIVRGGGMSGEQREWFDEVQWKEEQRRLFASITKQFQAIDTSKDGVFYFQFLICFCSFHCFYDSFYGFYDVFVLNCALGTFTL